MNSTASAIFNESPLTRNVKFGIFVVLTPPAIVCNCILVYYLLLDRTFRRVLHNHAILALLIATLLTNLIEVPRIIHFLHLGTVIPRSEVNCLIWQWSEYLLFAVVIVMILWISTERHLLIFYSHLYATANSRFLYHYLPLIVIAVYLTLFYIVVIFLYPCDRSFDFNQSLCGVPCYTTRPNITVYDFIAHTWIPLIMGIILDVTLVIRVIHRKRVGLQNRSTQRKHRKMVIQVLSISILYLILQTPASMVSFIQLFVVLSDWMLYIQIAYFFYLFWVLTLLIPFVCIGCIPEVLMKLKGVFIRRMGRNIAIVPEGAAQKIK